MLGACFEIKTHKLSRFKIRWKCYGYEIGYEILVFTTYGEI